MQILKRSFASIVLVLPRYLFQLILINTIAFPQLDHQTLQHNETRFVKKVDIFKQIPSSPSPFQVGTHFLKSLANMHFVTASTHKHFRCFLVFAVP